MLRHQDPRAILRRAALAVGLLTAGLAVVLVPPGRPAAAQPAAAVPAALHLVPTDAAVFVHADAAKLWDGSLGQALRGADPKTFDALTARAKELFGVTPAQLQTVTAFWPRFKAPPDRNSFGVVLTFRAAYDQSRLQAGLEKAFAGDLAFKLHTLSDTVAVVLVGLDDGFAQPRPANKPGPLTAAIGEAATGRHAVVAGVTLASLPDEIRGDTLPDDVRPFQAILRADTIVGVVDLDKELAVEVRVTSATAPKAVETEKALGLLVTLAREALDKLPRELGKDADKDPAMKDVLAILKAVQAGFKGATFATTGTEARARVAVPADLPFGRAFTAATAKVREAAARAQSFNNLKQLALVMHTYADATNGALPPAAVVDKTGKPLLSWRVLILPYVEQDKLYQQFKLDEPWDSPTNIKLLDKMPGVYAMPVPTKAKANETHYRAFVGNGAAFDPIKGTKFPGGFTDGLSNTIMVATAADPVPWTKPDDLAFDPDTDTLKLLGFFPGDVCPAAYGDGSVRGLPKTLDRKTLNALITRAGNEVLGDDAP